MNTYNLASAKELDIKKTFECGQCFRWNSDINGVYTGVAGDFPAAIWEDNGFVMIKTDGPLEFWKDYFDLNSDYESLSESFDKVPYLAECMKYGMGIRILRQDHWEALCSFIISQCNNIKRIKGIVERLCSGFGDTVFAGETAYRKFPPAERIAALEPEDLSVLRCGYRAPYIISAAREITDGTLDLQELAEADYHRARNRLIKMSGIGEKVANCAVLFGLHHMEAFPIDVWIKRALKEHFPEDFDPRTLGPYAGLAQQYIFYYTRENGG